MAKAQRTQVADENHKYKIHIETMAYKQQRNEYALIRDEIFQREAAREKRRSEI